MKKFFLLAIFTIALGTNYVVAQTYPSSNSGGTVRPQKPQKPVKPVKGGGDNTNRPLETGNNREDFVVGDSKDLTIKRDFESLYNHVKHWQDGIENGAARVRLDFIPSKEQKIEDVELLEIKREDIVFGTSRDGKEILVTGENAWTEGGLGFKLELAESSLVTLKKLRGSKFVVNLDGSFECKTTNGQFLCGGNFSKPDVRGDSWAFVTYNNEKLALKFRWTACAIDQRGTVRPLNPVDEK